MAVIPFYGTDRPDLFAIERSAMDAAGRVIEALDHTLPHSGLVLDVGAGNGHTARRMATATRSIVAMEPARRMIRLGRGPHWIQGDAEHLPFADASFDGAYATWAYFFSRGFDPLPGIGELHRVVRHGKPLVIVDNLGGDEFCAMAGTDITADTEFWADQGFACTPVETAFEFTTLDEAHRLLSFYFGEAGRAVARRSVQFRVGLFVGSSNGPTG